jgi:hypothetical protein
VTIISLIELLPFHQISNIEIERIRLLRQESRENCLSYARSPSYDDDLLLQGLSGAPAGTISSWDAFEPGSPDRESGILSASLQTGLYYRSKRLGKISVS